MSAPQRDNLSELLDLLAAAPSEQLSASAREEITRWLREPQYNDFHEATAEHIRDGRWTELNEAFWKVLEFGTGGRRGRMYPIGCNAINDRTIGECAQGLADYIRGLADAPADPSCAIAYDTRHRSRHFAELCAGILAANGFRVDFLNGIRSTPELSFAVRHKQCTCGIMVTASHNPPSDNAVKVYWSNGGQIVPPHDSRIVRAVGEVVEIANADFSEALAAGRVAYCEEEVDAAYQAAVLSQAQPGPRDLHILYSPLHGVGSSAVLPVLAADGFVQVEEYGPQAEPNGDFPNVPKQSANPESPEIYPPLIEHARARGAEFVLVTDPDCDRIGCAVPETIDPAGEWRIFTGNQLGALLADFVLERRPVGRNGYLVKTLVTTEMIRRIGDSYGVPTHGDLQVGFKWIGRAIDQLGPAGFLFGAEESHGYLVGQYARDKDGAVAAMLLAECAAACKEQRKTLAQKLDDLYWQHGYHLERTISKTMAGEQGMANMARLMECLRQSPPAALGGLAVKEVRDYESLTRRPAGGAAEPFTGPRGNMVMLELSEPGNYVAVRPSGTEPKVKFYLFSFTSAEQLANLHDARAGLDTRLDAIWSDLEVMACQVEAVQ